MKGRFVSLFAAALLLAGVATAGAQTAGAYAVDRDHLRDSVVPGTPVSSFGSGGMVCHAIDCQAVTRGPDASGNVVDLADLIECAIDCEAATGEPVDWDAWPLRTAESPGGSTNLAGGDRTDEVTLFEPRFPCAIDCQTLSEDLEWTP